MNTLTPQQARQRALANAQGLAHFRTLMDACLAGSRANTNGDAEMAGVHLECAERALLDLEVCAMYAPLSEALGTARWACSTLAANLGLVQVEA